jgi:hypothetical protein
MKSKKALNDAISAKAAGAEGRAGRVGIPFIKA